jgi:hypothetical protein
VVLADGALLGYLGRREKSLNTFLPKEQPERGQAARRLAAGLAALVDGELRRALIIALIDGAPARESELGPALQSAGFSAVGEGYVLRAERTERRRARAGG